MLPPVWDAGQKDLRSFITRHTKYKLPDAYKLMNRVIIHNSPSTWMSNVRSWRPRFSIPKRRTRKRLKRGKQKKLPSSVKADKKEKKKNQKTKVKANREKLSRVKGRTKRTSSRIRFRR